MGKRTWTKEEEEKLKQLYFQGKKIEDIAKTLSKTIGSIKHKVQRLRVCDEYIRKTSSAYKDVYQNYDWCYERYIIKGMTHQEMANEAGCKLRTIQKWCSDIYGLNQWTWRKHKHLTDIQYQIILFGTLGDGHIDNRINQPMYIECHSESEKEYLFWKYEQLKDICNNKPVYYRESFNSFGGEKEYLCQPFYRLNTRILDDLLLIRNVTRLDKIKMLNEFGFSLHTLDDGYRGDRWQVCLAEWTEEEINTYIKICKDRFGLECNREKDGRYVSFSAVSSKKIDEIILRNVPNDLDIINKKILNNDKIKNFRHHRYILVEDQKIGLASFCKLKHIDYDNCKRIFDALNVEYIDQNEFLKLVS